MNTEVTEEAFDRILGSRPSLPEHTVFRSFVTETVIMNLNTGQYHGTNTVGGTMLEVLDESNTVRDAAQALAARFGKPLQEIERDLVEFCVDLDERGLIVLEAEQPV